MTTAEPLIRKVLSYGFSKIFFWGEGPGVSSFLKLWKELGGGDLERVKKEELASRLEREEGAECAVLLFSRKRGEEVYGVLREAFPFVTLFPVFQEKAEVELRFFLRKRCRSLIFRLKSEGIQSVAVYGAGSHTKRLLDCWSDLGGPSVRGIVQSQPPETREFQGIPLFGKEEFSGEGVHGIVLSSATYEHELFRLCSSRWPHLPVYPLWDQRLQSPVPFLKRLLPALFQRCEQLGVRRVLLFGTLDRIRMVLPLWREGKGPAVEALYLDSFPEEKTFQGLPLLPLSEGLALEADALVSLNSGSSPSWPKGRIDLSFWIEKLIRWEDLIRLPETTLPSTSGREPREVSKEKEPRGSWGEWLERRGKRPPSELLAGGKDSLPTVTAVLFAQGEGEALLSESLESLQKQTVPYGDLLLVPLNREGLRQGERVLGARGTKRGEKLLPLQEGGTLKDLFRNIAKEVSGRYLLFLAGKDALSPWAIEAAAGAMARSPGAEVFIAQEGEKEGKGSLGGGKRWEGAPLEGFSQLILLERRLLLELDTAEEGQGPLEALTKALAEAGKRRRILHCAHPLYFSRPLPGSVSWGIEGRGEKLRGESHGTPLKVLLDARILSRKMTGSERYISELLRAMAPLSGEANLELQALVKEPPVDPLEGVRYIRRDPYKAIGQADLFHQTTQVYQRERLYEMAAGRSSLITFFDLISFTFREYFRGEREFADYRRYTVAATALADGVIAISEHNRKEIVKYLGVSPERVTPIPLAPPEGLRRSEDEGRRRGFLLKHGLSAGYLLAIGTNYPHKNLLRLLRAYGRVSSRIGGRPLVVVGARSFASLQADVEEKLRELQGRVFPLGHVPEEDLAELYSNAHGLVYPSLYEGFGLPPLEAMACGVPVAASNATSIPEVVGDAALLFDGEDENAIAEAIVSLSNDGEVRRRLVERGAHRVKTFRWEETAKRTIECYYETYRRSLSQDGREREERNRETLRGLDSTLPLVLIPSHVLFTPPGAGNELRIFNLVRHLRGAGFRVAYLYCPLDGRGATGKQKLEIEKYVDFFRQVDREARERALLGSSPLQDLLDKSLEPELRGVEEREKCFCPAAMLNAFDEMVRELKPSIVIAQYVWMSRLLKVLPEGILKVIDLHDKFSDKREKVLSCGVSDGLAITTEEEAALLNRADLVMAIQDLERRRFQELSVKPLVITTGVDFEPKYDEDPVKDEREPTVLIVASGNALNVNSLQTFLREVWSKRGESLGGLKLRVLGRVCENLTCEDPSVELAGYVPDLASEYRKALFVVNPVVAGTGLKIKSLEALSYGKALLSTPAGVEGLPDREGQLFAVARTGEEFVKRMGLLAGDSGLRERMEREAREYTVSSLSPSAVYGELLKSFNLFLKGAPR